MEYYVLIKIKKYYYNILIIIQLQLNKKNGCLEKGKSKTGKKDGANEKAKF